MTLGDKLKQLRAIRGWSQRELARQAGVRQTLLSELESGKKEDTTGENLRKLAETLKVSVDYLVGKRNDRPCPAAGRCLEGATPLPVAHPLHERTDHAKYSIPPY